MEHYRAVVCSYRLFIVATIGNNRLSYRELFCSRGISERNRNKSEKSIAIEINAIHFSASASPANKPTTSTSMLVTRA